MKYLIAEANYGGRVTDDFDRRLVNVYIGELFCEEAVSDEHHLLSELPDYFIPDNGDLKFMKETTRGMPQADHPLAFGQHPNADISSQIDDTNVLIETLVSLAPTVVKAVDENAEDPLARKSVELLEQCPGLFDMREVRSRMESRSDPDPLKTVLYQELDRYNSLLSTVRRTLSNISKAIQGLVAVTSELEEVMDSLLKLRVPKAWSKTYPSLKPLASWMRDLVLRCEQFRLWCDTDLPKQFWLSGFTYPSGFLTAVLQTAARANGVAIDALSWEFPVLQHCDTHQIQAHPKEGVFVSGLYVEGACWNYSGGFLEGHTHSLIYCAILPTNPVPYSYLSPDTTRASPHGARVADVHHPLPPGGGQAEKHEGLLQLPHLHVLHARTHAPRPFHPPPSTLTAASSIRCRYPFRSGSRERPSYVVSTELRCGKSSAEYWCKRGVALLLSTGM